MTITLVWRDPYGNKLTELSTYSRLEYSRAENRTGILYLDLDPDTIESVKDYLRVDARIEPWRTVGALPPYLDGETIFFIRKWGYKTDAQGRETLRIECRDPLYILEGTNVCYPINGLKNIISAQPADDACKVIWKENRGNESDDALWDLSAWVTCAANLSHAPTLTEFEYSRRQLSEILPEVTAWSLSQGTYLAYDIVYTSPTLLEFRTWTVCRGINRGAAAGANMCLISDKRKNLVEPEVSEDHLDEFNHIYVGGGKNNALSQQAKDTAAIGLSPFNRRAKWVPTNTLTANNMTHEAYSVMKKYRYKRRISGKVIDTEGCLYGVHYRFGDLVRVEYRGYGFDAHVDAIHVTVDQQRGEQVEVRVKGEV